MQKTIASPFKFNGIGLHTGEVCSVKVIPSMDFGIHITNGEESTRLDSNSLRGGVLGTNVFFESGKSIRTVEHFLSALFATGVTNAIIEVKGGEMPIMDGSSKVFFDLIDAVGVKDLTSAVPMAALKEKIIVRNADKFISIEPRTDSLKVINVDIDFSHPYVDKMPQKMTYSHSYDAYRDTVSLARTFGFQKDIEKLLEKKLCIGGSTNNAVVIAENGILNPDGLRIENELVAHKLLDVIGDLSPILPLFEGFTICSFKPGHALNNELLRKVSQRL